jgi:hypothetical protein
MRWVRVVAMGSVLAGCAGGGGSGGQMTWMRADGRPVDAGFRAAADQCRGVAARAGGGAPGQQREATMKPAMQNCMEQRGYVWQCSQPLALGQAACGDGDAPADKGPRPARSEVPGRSTT